MNLKLPELGEGVHEGEFVKWHVKAGDTVKFDQLLGEIMTDKATVEIPASFQGKITALSVKEGQTVKVGQTILEYDGTGASAKAQAPAATAPTATAPAPAAMAPMAPAPAPAARMAPALNTDPATRPLAAPSTRRAARELGVDLAQISGSGPGGRIVREDLDRARNGNYTGAQSAGSAMPAPTAPAPSKTKSTGLLPGASFAVSADTLFAGATEKRVPFMGLRKKIAEKMTTSKHTAAHFTYVEEADVTELVKLRAMAKDLGAARGIKVTYLPFVMKAMVAALKYYPILNSTLDESQAGSPELVYRNYFNIGLSIQTDDGLTAPVVKDVGNRTILELAQDIQNLVDRARAKKLTKDDLTGSTITLTNAGSIGGLFATPVINYPEVAILGFNKIARKPVVKTVGGREEIQIRDWTYFSISLDHRVVDGAVGAEYMNLFIKYIENPGLLMLDQL